MTDRLPIDQLVARVKARADARPALPPARPVAPELDPADVVAAAGERWRAMIPARFVSVSFDGLSADRFRGGAADVEVLRGWCDDPAGRNVVILGDVGRGKSWTAAAMLRVRFDRGDAVAFYPVEAILDALRPGGPERALERFVGFDVLVVDEVAGERPTDWTFERFSSLVNRRWLEERPTVFTSNLTPKELEEHVGPRAYSRMTGGAVRIRMVGDDRRRSD